MSGARLLLEGQIETFGGKELGQGANSTAAVLVQAVFDHKCRVLFGALKQPKQRELFDRGDLHGDQLSAAEERGHQIVRIVRDKSVGNDDGAFELEVQSNGVQFDRVIQHFIVHGDDDIGLGVRGVVVLQRDGHRFVVDFLRARVICANHRAQLQLGVDVDNIGL